MAAESAPETPTAGETPPSGPSESKLPLFIGLANTVVLLAAAGTFLYTRVLFERPKITEESERTRIEKLKETPQIPDVPELVSFPPVTLNLKPDATIALSPAAAGLPGKLHYATVGFAIEIRHSRFKDRIEKARPQIMDQFLQMMGKKNIHEINSVEGRYHLKTEMIDMINTMVTASDEIPIVSNIHFAKFILQ